jgi:hypothetical protein
MMTTDKLEKAIAEAERFIVAARLARVAVRAEQIESDMRMAAHDRGEPYTYPEHPSRVGVHTGAARRASMDPTRALADLRRYS